MEFLREGGFGIWVVLVLGGVAVARASMFAFKPREASPVVIKALSLATVFTILGSSAAGFREVMRAASGAKGTFVDEMPVHQIVIVGLGEVATIAVLGFGLLGLAWMLVTVGAHRLGLAHHE